MPRCNSGAFSFYSHHQTIQKTCILTGSCGPLSAQPTENFFAKKAETRQKSRFMWITCYNLGSSTLIHLFPIVEKLSQNGKQFQTSKPTTLKKSEERLLIYGAIGAVGLLVFFKARALGNLIIAPGQITDMGFSGGTPVATFNVIVQNTSNASITINSFAGNVFSNNIQIGNVFGFTPVLITGNSQTIVPVQVQFKALGVVNDLIRAFQNNNFSQAITVAGFANVLGLQLPVNINLTAGNPNNPQI